MSQSAQGVHLIDPAPREDGATHPTEPTADPRHGRKHQQSAQHMNLKSEPHPSRHPPTSPIPHAVPDVLPPPRQGEEAQGRVSNTAYLTGALVVVWLVGTH